MRDKAWLENLRQSISERWRVVDHLKIWPWLRRPCEVRILMYAEGGIQFNGGSFLGLNHVLATLHTDPWYWVRFQVTKANRGSDPSADHENVQLTASTLDVMNKFDQIWFFGFSGGDLLTAAEKTLLAQFMGNPKKGGVLVTGDHANLGKGIAGAIPRAGKMRLYPAPPNSPPTWNTTVEEGSDPNTTFDHQDQSDDVPQQLRLRRYYLWPSLVLRRRWRPHPVMCGPSGPIEVFPDHQHEGEAIVPATLDPSEWPEKAGYREAPEVIVWGKIKEPTATKFGQEIGVVSAYNGHNVDVGRIVADATWHHWFDINLTGIPGSPIYQGFPASAAGQAALKDIEAYFLNVGVWLAPPNKQQCMRNAAWWGLVWHDRFVEFDIERLREVPFVTLGEQAIDVLGRVATRCTRLEWFLDLPILVERFPRWRWEELLARFHDAPFRLPVEEYVMGHIVAALLEQYGRSDRRTEPPKAPGDDELNALIAKAAPHGLRQLVSDVEKFAGGVQDLVRTAAGEALTA